MKGGDQMVQILFIGKIPWKNDRRAKIETYYTTRKRKSKRENSKKMAGRY